MLQLMFEFILFNNCGYFSNLKKMKCNIQWTWLIWTPRGNVKLAVSLVAHTKRALRHKIKDTCFINKRTKADIFKRLKFTLT